MELAAFHPFSSSSSSPLPPPSIGGDRTGGEYVVVPRGLTGFRVVRLAQERLDATGTTGLPDYLIRGAAPLLFVDAHNA